MSAITTVTSEVVEAEDDWLTICGRHHKHVYIGWFWFLVFFNNNMALIGWIIIFTRAKQYERRKALQRFSPQLFGACLSPILLLFFRFLRSLFHLRRKGVGPRCRRLMMLDKGQAGVGETLLDIPRFQKVDGEKKRGRWMAGRDKRSAAFFSFFVYYFVYIDIAFANWRVNHGHAKCYVMPFSISIVRNVLSPCYVLRAG